MSNTLNKSMSLANPDAHDLSKKQKLSVGLGVVGLFILVLALFNLNLPNKATLLTLSLSLITIGIILFANDAYLSKSKGIKNDGVWFKSISSRGTLAWITGIVLTSPT